MMKTLIRGFRFVDQNEQLKPFDLKINQLFSSTPDDDERTRLRKQYTKQASDEDIETLIETNLNKLWEVFVGTGTESLAYFSIASKEEYEVNEVFERLNTGGIPLSKADLLYSKIKAVYPDFETEIMEFSKNMFKRWHFGLESYDILQILHMIVKRRSRIDENASSGQIEEFKKAWNQLQEPLNAFFDDYLHHKFNITHMAIIRNKIPLLVMIVFFFKYYETGKKYRNIDAQNLQLIDKFFITAEINDWALQSYADNFTRIIMDNPDKSKYPLDKMVEFVKNRGNRWIDVTEAMFKSYRWMALKFMMPHRSFVFDYSMPNRFNPELDHIFPINLEGADKEYQQFVDTIWNMQPVKGEINNWKKNFHPRDFLKDLVKNAAGETINGSKFKEDYDFVPDLSDSSWNDYKQFIDNRRKVMMEYVKTQYDISIIPEDNPS